MTHDLTRRRAAPPRSESRPERLAENMARRRRARGPARGGIAALILLASASAALAQTARIEGFRQDRVVLYTAEGLKRVIPLDGTVEGALRGAALEYRGAAYWVVYEGRPHRLSPNFFVITNTKPKIDDCARKGSGGTRLGASGSSGVTCPQ